MTDKEQDLEAIKAEWLKIGLSTEPANRPEAEKYARIAYEKAGHPFPNRIEWRGSPLEGAKLAAEFMGTTYQEQISSAFYSQQDAGWLSYYDGYKDQFQEEYASLEGLMGLAKNCGWCWFFDEAVILTERATLIKLDEQERLHNPSGPAIAYPDGFGMYAWHGVAVPKEWIEAPDTVDPQTALTHPNIEERRALCEILGWSKVIAKLKAKTIHKDPDPEIGTLLEVDLPEIGKSRFLRVQCGTGREFVLPVPNNLKTARSANAWTYGLKPEQYNPEERT